MVVDPAVHNEVERLEDKTGSLLKTLATNLDEYQAERIDYNRKAFTVDPDKYESFVGLYRRRDNLLPYHILKQLVDNDSLMASILNTRSAQISSFGHPQINRHDVGYRIVFRSNEIENGLDSSQRDELKERMNKCRDLFYHCGKIDGFALSARITFPQFLKETARNALLFGSTSTELIKDALGEFCAFRTVDAGTIYKAPIKDQDTQELRNVRKRAIQDLRDLRTNQRESINLDHFQLEDIESGKYSWVQVINNIPRMCFTDQELLVHNYYPVSDIENNGYPRPPADTVSKALATHISISTHNHLYFSNGRATKGFLTIKGEGITESTIQRIRQQFNASINSVSNSWRMPVFGISKDDEVSWMPFDGGGGRDMEFQYLSDNNSREIMSAFSITPEEIPGYGHLSKPTVTQALSESNNEYALQVARAAGLKPLMMEIQAMMNNILMQLDPLVYKYCIFKFVGLEAEDPSKESVRLQQEANLHLTSNEMLRIVGKNPLSVGGNFPLNPALLNILNQQIPKNLLTYAFTGDKLSLTNPLLFYIGDAFYMQHVTMFKELLKSKGRIQSGLQDCMEELKQILIECSDKK